MPGGDGALGGAATGAGIGFSIGGPLGAGIGAGAGALIGWLGGRKKKSQGEKLLEERYGMVSDPNYLRGQFLDTARELAPSQSDILGRLRASGLGFGQASALADRQFAAEQSRAREAGASAFNRFQLGNQQNINNLLTGIINQDNYNQDRKDSYNNQLLGIGAGFAGQYLGNRLGG